MAREVDTDFIGEHAHMFDRVQVPGGLWVTADVVSKSGDIYYEEISKPGVRPLPVGSHLQAAGLGIVKFIRKGQRGRPSP
ncbi:MAG: hypothetical protein V2A58_16595 [Planctomycetota bacterium]